MLLNWIIKHMLFKIYYDKSQYNQPLNADRLFDAVVMSITKLVDKTSFLLKVFLQNNFLIIISEAVLIKPSVRGGGLAATSLLCNS